MNDSRPINEDIIQILVLFGNMADDVDVPGDRLQALPKQRQQSP